jgi:DNA-directed RNA polymerase specialized sigma24 family protein
MAMPSISGDRSTLLGAPEFRAGLVRFVRGRVPEAEVEDVVQATLADAFAADRAPDNAEDLRRWVYGIAKNKIVDVHRRGGREAPREAPMDEHASAESAPVSARDLLRWAEKELPQNEGAKSTLEWMLREGAGEKLEHIAAEERLPPDRVRQRVSRLRRHFKSRWALELAAAAALGVLALALWAIWRGRATPGPENIAKPEHVLTPEERAGELRRAALERCKAEDWKPCVDGLDRAKALDPKGDDAPNVQQARAAASKALAPPPEPSQVAPPAPTESAPPVPAKPIPTDVMKGSSESSIDLPKKAPKAGPAKTAPAKTAAPFEPWGSSEPPQQAPQPQVNAPQKSAPNFDQKK